MTLTENRVPSSFRDPSGFLFVQEGCLFRHVGLSYREDYEALMESGLYQRLIEEELLVAHEEVKIAYEGSEDAFKTIKPEQIPFISYPYEWSFSQLKDAALTTIRIQKVALDHEMTLKDSSAYNVQFRHGKPILIDTLSFEKYREGEPWVAYRQFCQHFLAPLVVMAHHDIRLQQLLRIHIDGIPLDLASSLLPWTSYFRPSLLMHIHIHARAQKRYGSKGTRSEESKKMRMSKTAFLGLIDGLESAVGSLKWKPAGTEWADYYEDTNYSKRAMQAKSQVVSHFLGDAKSSCVWDMGANMGQFSRLASQRGIRTIAFDMDPASVEKNYLKCREDKDKHLLPLLLDLTNPNPAIGWENRERMSLFERGPVDTVMALALIHHLAISNNVPLSRIASFFSRLCRHLIVEFVPKTDSQVQRLLASRQDIFDEYTQEGFERSFGKFFTVLKSETLPDSGRTLYLMTK